MPFASTAQQRWAFATRQDFARRWARATNFDGLPKRARRKWGQRRKALPTPARQLRAGHTGVMVALMVPPDVAQRIVALDGVTEPAEQLHLTLCFLGDSTETPLSNNQERVLAAVRDWALRSGQPVEGTINGVGRFYNAESDGTNAVYLAPDLPALPALRQSLVEAIDHAGFDYAQNHGFTPHITVAYVPEGAPTPDIHVEAPIRFDRVTLAWGDAQYDFPLGAQAATKAATYTYSFKAAGPPGEQIAPGVTRIRGNLCNVHGRYGPCDASASVDRRPTAPGMRKKPKKAARPKPTPEQRQAERDAKAQQNRAQAYRTLGLLEDATASLDALARGEAVADDGGLVKLGLAEQNPDGTYRLTATGRALHSAASSGNLGAARDALGRGASAVQEAASRDAKRQERQAAAEQRKREVAQRRAEAEAQRQERAKKRPAGGAARKPAAEQATPAQRQQQQGAERAQAARDTAARVGLTPADTDALRQARDAGGVTSPALAALGLVGDDGFTTDQGRRALAALEAGDTGRYHAALQDARARQGREAAAADRRTATEARRAATAQRRADAESQRQAAARQRQGSGREQSRLIADRAIRNIAARRKSFTVVKDARTGQLRWVARSTTAYRDRDREILSIAALDADSQRMTVTKQYGPLRFWHIGRPDPTNAAAPWGPGVDIGDCDFSMQIGTTRVESGTFRSPAIARRVQATADQYELSPGFFHPEREPSPDGVFGHMHTFERSVVPVRYARASNLFTGLTVKETRMDPEEMARRLQVAAKALGVPVDVLAAGLAQTDKSAAALGIAFKAADAPPDEVTIGGVTYTLKAPMPPAEMVAAGTTEAEDGADEEAAADLAEPVADFIGDMSRADFEALLMDVFARAVQGMGSDISAKMAAMDEQLKGMGYARAKEASDAAKVADRVAQLEAQLKEARAQLAGLTDDAARRGRGYRPSQDGADADVTTAAALKTQQQPGAVHTGNAAVDAVARWLAPDGQLPPIPGLNGVALGGLFGAPATESE